MLTGRRAFAGATRSDTIVAVLDREPDWSALPDGYVAVNPAAAAALPQKDPRRRLRDIGDARTRS